MHRAPEKLEAHTATCATPPCVTYTAAGTFATTVTQGTDPFKLAGQRFDISINDVPESLQPANAGKGHARYSKLNITGTVFSALIPTPVTLTSNAAQLGVAIERTESTDRFAMYFPVKVLGITFDLTATGNLPFGTITNTTIAPYTAPVTLTSGITSVTYLLVHPQRWPAQLHHADHRQRDPVHHRHLSANSRPDCPVARWDARRRCTARRHRGARP